MDTTKYKTLDELPLSLTVVDIRDILGISTKKAYELCASSAFPRVKIGSKVTIPRPEFVKWYRRSMINN